VGSTQMRFERVGRDHFVVVHTTAPPSDAEWERYITALCDPASAPVRTILVVTAGGSPNAAQRKRFVESTEKRGAQPRVAILSPSALVRTIIAAFNLFVPQPMRMFAPTDSRGAFGYLGVSASERVALAAVATRLARELNVSVEDLQAA
jgi:hypothetical protein